MKFSSTTLLALLLAGQASADPTCTPARDDYGRIARSRAVVAEFKRQHPCPVTGSARGTCPGLVIDHIIPLCACGVDAVENMQWQTVEDAKAKDRDERRLCASMLHSASP